MNGICGPYLYFPSPALLKQLLASVIKTQDPSLAGMPLSDAEYEHFFKTLNSPHRATAICYLRGMYGCQNPLIQTLDLYENHGIVPEGRICSNMAEMPTFPDFCTLSFYRCTVKNYFVKRIQCPDENSETSTKRPISSHHHLHMTLSSTISPTLIPPKLTTMLSLEHHASESPTHTVAIEGITPVLNNTAEAGNVSETVVIAADSESTSLLPADASSAPNITDSESLLELLTSLDAMIAGQSFPKLFTTHHPLTEETFQEQPSITSVTLETPVPNLPITSQETVTVSENTSPMTETVTISGSRTSIVSKSSSELTTAEAVSPSLRSTARNPAATLILEASLSTAADHSGTASTSSPLSPPISKTLPPSTVSPLYSIMSWPPVPISGILGPYKLHPTSVMEIFILASTMGPKNSNKSEGGTTLSSLLQISSNSTLIKTMKGSAKSKHSSPHSAGLANFLSQLQDRRVQQLMKKVRELVAKGRKKQRQLKATSLQLLRALERAKIRIKSSFSMMSRNGSQRRHSHNGTSPLRQRAAGRRMEVVQSPVT